MLCWCSQFALCHTVGLATVSMILNKNYLLILLRQWRIIIMSKKLISVVELPEFQKFAKNNLNEKECFEIIHYIAANPDQGDIIKGTEGIRKLRFTLSSNNKGKSGSIRIIYFYYNENMPVFLITGFIKSKMENINHNSCNELKKLTEELVKLYVGQGRNE